jgi:hypothetical protein
MPTINHAVLLIVITSAPDSRREPETQAGRPYRSSLRRLLPTHNRPEPILAKSRAIAPIGTTFSGPVNASSSIGDFVLLFEWCLVIEVAAMIGDPPAPPGPGVCVPVVGGGAVLLVDGGGG